MLDYNAASAVAMIVRTGSFEKAAKPSTSHLLLSHSA